MGCKKNCSSAIWMRSEIGALHRNTSKACGGFCSSVKATISCWLLAKPTLSASLSKPLLPLNLDWKQYVKHDPRYERPAEVDILVGDASKAREALGWEPKVRFHELVRIMVDADIALLSREMPREHLGKLP